MLYIVSTPIGNMKDITLRALDILKEADIVFAEDTRRTGILLHQYNLSKKMISYNDINKESKFISIFKFFNIYINKKTRINSGFSKII